MASEETNQLYRILSLIDLTSLESTDTEQLVQTLCRKALDFGMQGLPLPAAVCVFSPFISTARKELIGSGIAIATVACGFPHGQAPLSAKTAEIRFALEEGADEIDVVFSRGLLLSGANQQLTEELALIREISRPAVLKVILETGELQTPAWITLAAETAMEAGADFIKTSTGRHPVGATIEAVKLMAEAVAGRVERTGTGPGIKVAGGVSTPEQAILYMNTVAAILGEEWITPSRFRIGTSRLADQIAGKIRSA